MTLNATTGMIATLIATENNGSLNSEKVIYTLTFIGVFFCMFAIYALLSYIAKCCFIKIKTLVKKRFSK